jgi:hypothetical protein
MGEHQQKNIVKTLTRFVLLSATELLNLCPPYDQEVDLHIREGFMSTKRTK